MQRKFSSERLGWRGSWEQLFRIIYTGLLSTASKSSRWAKSTFCWPQGYIILPFPSSDIKGLAERRSPSHHPLELHLSPTAVPLASRARQGLCPSLSGRGEVSSNQEAAVTRPRIRAAPRPKGGLAGAVVLPGPGL